MNYKIAVFEELQALVDLKKAKENLTKAQIHYNKTKQKREKARASSVAIGTKFQEIIGKISTIDSTDYEEIEELIEQFYKLNPNVYTANIFWKRLTKEIPFEDVFNEFILHHDQSQWQEVLCNCDLS